MLTEVNALLKERAALLMSQGTLIDATLIAAPAQRKQPRQRDPKCESNQKGNEWHFGMKAHYWCR
jgi:IS5 family transposase